MSPVFVLAHTKYRNIYILNIKMGIGSKNVIGNVNVYINFPITDNICVAFGAKQVLKSMCQSVFVWILKKYMNFILSVTGEFFFFFEKIFLERG